MRSTFPPQPAGHPLAAREPLRGSEPVVLASVPLKAPNIVAECYGDLTSVLLLSSGQTLFGSWVAGQGGEGSPQWPGAFLTLT